MDRDLVSPGPSLAVEPSAHSGEEEIELDNGSAATSLGLLFPASAVTLLGPRDAASSSDPLDKSCLQIWILVPWPVWHSTAAQAPAGALHWWPTVLPTSHHAPSFLFSFRASVAVFLKEQSHMLGPVHHPSTQGHLSPSQPLALSLGSQCARSLPIHLLRMRSQDSPPPN